MRLVVQRVTRGRVTIGGRVAGEIGRGAVLLVGIAAGDSPEIVDRMADKLLSLRYFRDDEGRTNLAIAEIGGELLAVSQFTLYADVRRGRRPGFTQAALPEVAAPLVDRFVERLQASGIGVRAGEFGAAMELELSNEGPFTLLLDSERDLGGVGGG